MALDYASNISSSLPLLPSPITFLENLFEAKETCQSSIIEDKTDLFNYQELKTMMTMFQILIKKYPLNSSLWHEV